MRITNFLGKLFSFLFNPLFMPLLGIIGILYWSSDTVMVMHPAMKNYLLLITTVFHCLLPLITVALMKLLGLTSSIELPRRRDRLMPIALSLGYAVFGYFFLVQIPGLDFLFYLLPLGSSAVLLTAFFFTSRFQISIHLMAVGALTATYVLATQFLGMNLFIPVLVSVAIAGCTAFARIRLNAHKPYQVYWGYLTGFAAHYFSVIIFYFLLRN